MTALVVNENACGVWKQAVGTVVTLTEPKLSPNKKAAHILMPGKRDDKTGFKPGKKCWVPVKWLDGLEPTNDESDMVACGPGLDGKMHGPGVTSASRSRRQRWSACVCSRSRTRAAARSTSRPPT